jgi:hypothetical protein
VVLEPESNVCPVVAASCTSSVKMHRSVSNKVPAKVRVAGIIQAPGPWREGGLQTEVLVADVVVSKHADHLPLPAVADPGTDGQPRPELLNNLDKGLAVLGKPTLQRPLTHTELLGYDVRQRVAVAFAYRAEIQPMGSTAKLRVGNCQQNPNSTRSSFPRFESYQAACVSL